MQIGDYSPVLGLPLNKWSIPVTFISFHLSLYPRTMFVLTIYVDLTLNCSSLLWLETLTVFSSLSSFNMLDTFLQVSANFCSVLLVEIPP